MAHLFEHMLFKKTQKFADVKQELTKLGGMINGTTWFDRCDCVPADEPKLKTAVVSQDAR